MEPQGPLNLGKEALWYRPDGLPGISVNAGPARVFVLSLVVAGFRVYP